LKDISLKSAEPLNSTVTASTEIMNLNKAAKIRFRGRTC
jgi:hypothetical protein